MSWNNAKAFCDWSGLRLPSEAEWEYACRAGSDGRYCHGDGEEKLGDHAWYRDNSGTVTHEVGKLNPNRWGLYDMFGNVAEWCNDIYSDSYYAESSRENPRGPQSGKKRVLRGGAWNSSASACRASARYADMPGISDACFARNTYGFRCVRRSER